MARAVDKDPTQLMHILKAAYEHRGCSFVEIYQDCNIFNHGAFDEFALKSNRSDHTILLEQGEPLVYGENRDKALLLVGDELQKTAYDPTTAYQHQPSSFLGAMRLAKLNFPDYPVPLGVYYQQEREIYTLSDEKPIERSMEDLRELYASRASWQQQSS